MSAGNRGGRPAKPTALKVLEGTARKDRTNDAEPQFPALLAEEPPGWLDEIAREHWGYYAPMLTKSGVMTEADASLLAAASEQWSVYRRASGATKGKTPRTLWSRNRFGERVPRIEVGIAGNALQRYTTIMREFGVGPASRSRVKSEKPPERDEFEEAFG